MISSCLPAPHMLDTLCALAAEASAFFKHVEITCLGCESAPMTRYRLAGPDFENLRSTHDAITRLLPVLRQKAELVSLRGETATREAIALMAFPKHDQLAADGALILMRCMTALSSMADVYAVTTLFWSLPSSDVASGCWPLTSSCSG